MKKIKIRTKIDFWIGIFLGGLYFYWNDNLKEYIEFFVLFVAIVFIVSALSDAYKQKEEEKKENA